MFLLTHRTKIVLGLRSSLTGVLFFHQLIPLRRAETKEVIIGVIIGQKTNAKNKLQNKHAKSCLLPPANWVEKLKHDNILFLLFISQVGVDWYVMGLSGCVMEWTFLNPPLFPSKMGGVFPLPVAVLNHPFGMMVCINTNTNVMINA